LVGSVPQTRRFDFYCGLQESNPYIINDCYTKKCKQKNKNTFPAILAKRCFYFLLAIGWHFPSFRKIFIINIISFLPLMGYDVKDF